MSCPEGLGAAVQAGGWVLFALAMGLFSVGILVGLLMQSPWFTEQGPP